MSKPESEIDKPSEIRHLRRTIETSLELAIMARAPGDLVNRLARVSGLLEAVAQLPTDAGPAREMTPSLIVEATAAAALWRAWEEARTPAA